MGEGRLSYTPYRLTTEDVTSLMGGNWRELYTLQRVFGHPKTNKVVEV